MPSYTTPARVRFARSDDSGVTPPVLAPGSFFINWRDQKIYVGGADGTPQRITQWMTDWSSALNYREGDFVIFDGDIYRARRNLTSNTPITSADWQALTSTGRSLISEPYATSSLAGGTVSITGPTTLAVTAGAGIVVNNDNPINIVDEGISWGAFNVNVPPGPAWRVLGIDVDGVQDLIDISNMSTQWRAEHVLLAYVLWDGATGQIADVLDAAIPAGDTAEAFRDLYFAGGGGFRISGGRLSPTGGLSLAMTQVVYFALGAEWRVDPASPNLGDIDAQDPLEVQYAVQDSIVGTPVTALDPDQWDDGGTLTAVPAGQVTIQFMSAFPTAGGSDEVYLQYGQTTYSSMSTALSNVTVEWDNLVKYAVGGPSIILAAVILQQGATDLSTDAFIVPAVGSTDPFGSSFGASADTSQFLLIDGSRPMTGDLNMDGNEINNAIIDGGTFA